MQGAPPLRVMFWLSRSSASFFPKHINPHISLLRRLQFKGRRAVSAHTRRDALFTLSLSQKLYKSPRHTPDFATIRSRAVRFCRSVPLRRPISPPKFSSATPKFAARFFITDARFPPPDLKNCDRSQTKSQKLRVRAANKQKRLLLPSMPISPLKTYRNRKIGGNTPQTPQAVAHHKRRNLTKNRLFLDIPTFISHVAIGFSRTTENLIAAREIAMLANNHTPALSFTTITRFKHRKETDAPSQHHSANQKAVKTQKTDEPPRKKKAHSHLYKSKKMRYFHQQTALTTPSARQKNGLFPRQNSHSRKTYSIFVKQGKNYRFFV